MENEIKYKSIIPGDAKIIFKKTNYEAIETNPAPLSTSTSGDARGPVVAISGLDT